MLDLCRHDMSRRHVAEEDTVQLLRVAECTVNKLPLTAD
jgi:hypothetical protein